MTIWLTSNVLAGKQYHIPVVGTHAHSWVTAFENEKDAFSAYAKVMPNNCVLLVDTYNSINGIKNAIDIAENLRAEGSELIGLRLDSGDMADLSKKARTLLDEAGFENVRIIASNTLNENVIQSIKAQGGKITSWGVGTQLVTAYDQPALDGVYKLSSLQAPNGKWQYKLKLSETPVKVSNPGRHQVRRFFYDDKYVIDVIYDLDMGIEETPEYELLDGGMIHVRLDDYDAFVDLLQPVMRGGSLVQALEDIHTVRREALAEVNHFYHKQDEGLYPVGLEKRLANLKHKLIHELRENHSGKVKID